MVMLLMQVYGEGRLCRILQKLRVNYLQGSTSNTKLNESQPFSMTASQGTLLFRNKHTRVQVCRQICQNSSKRDTPVIYLASVFYNTGTSYHYPLFTNISVCHPNRTARTKTSKRLSLRTQLRLASGASSLIKQACSQFNAMAESCGMYLCTESSVSKFTNP